MDKVGGKTSVKEELAKAKKEVAEVIKQSHCSPILVRLAWHDSGTYDKASAALEESNLLAQPKPTGQTFHVHPQLGISEKKSFSLHSFDFPKFLKWHLSADDVSP